MKPMNGVWFLLLLIEAPLASAGLFSRSHLEVNVNVTVTDEGRAMPIPSPEHPVYYLPAMAGYRELGAVTAGEKSPPKKLLTDYLARTLADEGYLVMNQEHAPTVLLVFHWGYLNPDIQDKPAGGMVFFNQNEALSLVLGSTLEKHGPTPDLAEVKQSALDDRYFVIVAAYDYAAAVERKKVLLWRARMSAPSAGVSLAEVIPTLIKTGGPHFGRETDAPVVGEEKIFRPGKVELAPLQFLDDDLKAPHKSKKQTERGGG
jgi:hypothetical protein